MAPPGPWGAQGVEGGLAAQKTPYRSRFSSDQQRGRCMWTLTLPWAVLVLRACIEGNRIGMSPGEALS